MMNRLGYPGHTEVPDQATLEEFQQVFALSLSPSIKEAMRELFPGRPGPKQVVGECGLSICWAAVA
jgi:hypothetical protein